MVDNFLTTKDIKDSSSGSGLDAVIEKLERYCNYLQNELNKKMCSGENGAHQNQKHMADDARLERGLS